MKIQKKYQGAIPLNRIANEHNESELNTYSTLYLNSKFCAISSTQPTDGEEVWVQKSNNLFKETNNRKDRVGAYLGVVYGNVSLVAGQQYTVSFTTNNNGGYVYIHETCKFSEYKRVQCNGNRYDITVTATETLNLTNNVMLSTSQEVTNPYDITDFQIVSGNVGLPYEPYIDKKIYVKNDNGVYEEFCRAENKSAVLWENKTPTSNFGPQSIQLSSDDYDYLEFAFCPNTGNSEAYWFKVKKGHNITAQLITGGTSAVYIRNRICDRVSDTEYSLRDSRTFSALNAANSEVDNSRVIPLCVIGYKY